VNPASSLNRTSVELPKSYWYDLCNSYNEAKRICGAWAKSSPDGPKVMQKPQKNTVNGTLDLTQL
jgi:hypothetical protein